jgi:hypothetical protein
MPRSSGSAPAGLGRPSSGSPMRSARPWPAASPVVRRWRARASMPSVIRLLSWAADTRKRQIDRKPYSTRSSRARSGRSPVWAGRLDLHQPSSAMSPTSTRVTPGAGPSRAEISARQGCQGSAPVGPEGQVAAGD